MQHTSNKQRPNILLDTYKKATNGEYNVILDNIRKLKQQKSRKDRKNKQNEINYIDGTSKTAYRKIHSILTTVLEKIMSDPSRKDKYLPELVEATILIQYQSERGQLNSHLADELISIIEDYINEINKLNNFETVRKHARVIKMIIDAILALHYNNFKKY